MSTTKQTRCPHCTSVFNITDDQLAARGGHVRCGSCLQVFRADQHLVDASQIVDIPAASPQAAAPISTPPVAPKNTSDSQMSMPVVAKEQHAPPQPQPAPAKKRKKDDESWAMDLLGDLGAELEDDLANINPQKSVSAPISEPEEKPQPSKTKKPLFDDEISDLLQEAWVEPTDSAPLKGLGGVDKIKESADESWAQALMSELEEEEKKEKAKNYSMELAPQRPKDPNAKTKTKEPIPEKADTETSAKKSSNNSHEDDDLLSFLNKSASTTAQPQRINPTLPLEIKSQPMISINWGYWLTWSFMCIFATILLLVQYVYFHFNELAFDEKTRLQLVQI
ncbi:MAG TPA: zinc-ribbon domain-containing protein, partial [Agitococcus sp.]|nr:zinc-ribbon domain-containing protein [Agitococcus sp.]